MAVNPPFNLHPWRVYPVKFSLFFSRRQKHMRFSRVASWEKKWAIFVQKEKRPGCFFSFLITITLKKNGCHSLEILRCFCHLGKNRVYFTGYPSNHFQIKRRNIGGSTKQSALTVCSCFGTFHSCLAGLGRIKMYYICCPTKMDHNPVQTS